MLSPWSYRADINESQTMKHKHAISLLCTAILSHTPYAIAADSPYMDSLPTTAC